MRTNVDFIDFGLASVTLPIRPSYQTASSYDALETLNTCSDGSMFPFRDITSIVQSPHEPPINVLPQNIANNIRNNVIKENNSRLFPNSDYFQDYLEDRLVRWKPTDSQHNNESTILGKHPFQLLDYGRKSRKVGPFKFLSTISSWFVSENVIESPELNVGSSSELMNSIQPSVTNLSIKKRNDRGRNYDNIIGKLTLRPNSSISIMPGSVQASQQSNGVTNHINNVPNLSQHPSYTPRAIPVKDYDLNFTKRRDSLNNSDDNLSVLDTLDNDIRHLVDGNDNFVVNCLDGIRNIFLSAVAFCCGPIE